MIKYELTPSYQFLEKDLLNIKNIFKNDNKIIHNARNILKIIPLSGMDIVVKAFKIPNFINQFVYSYIRNSKAKKSYLNSIKLEKLQINTPSPIAFIEFYKNTFFKESFFLSLKFDYEITMADVRDKEITDKENILKQFARFSYDIHQKGVWHVDYSGGNVLINKNKDIYEFSLVDINRMKFQKIEAYKGLENFNKFWFNEDDLKIIAKEYSICAGLNETKSINEIILQDKKLKEHVLRRRKLKALFKGRN